MKKKVGLSIVQVTKNPLEVRFAKERQKFAAAHFTIFDDGTVERLHGHNYHVVVRIQSSQLELGLVFPFHTVKKHINALCDDWDEYVLMPKDCPWFAFKVEDTYVEGHLQTPAGVDKLYRFPREDVIMLDCDNVSSEHLALLFAERLKAELDQVEDLHYDQVWVEISESSGQSVTASF
jgi:6-pyruvoyltetrahydropterin/6-carboxytetrahydropterin synthase